METLNQQLCQNCNRKIQGRSDKKFCNDNCRNTYHNKHKRPESFFVRNIKAILNQNRRILSEALGDKPTCKIHRAELVSKGFHFEVISQLASNQRGTPTYFCYDFGYRAVTESCIQIFKQENKL